jgi:crotonobetainyl-CoA:carnitine CoA-transferase CaiB-like acyl-CoA transferase
MEHTMTETSPLAGLKVIDFGDAWSVPFACTMLADAGADVIKVEDIHRQLSTLRGPTAPTGPLDGYPDRDPGERPWNRYYLFNNSERNKRGITLDLTQPEGRALFDRLIAECDIFATNYTPRAVQNLGLTFDDLTRLNPRIIYAHVTGYGCAGELAEAVALGSSIDAWTGHMALRGYRETTPYDTGLSYFADALGAAHLLVAVLTALRARDQGGAPQCIELALTETLIPALARPLLETVVTGAAPAVHGNRDPEWAPQGVYPVRGDDRWIAIAARTEREWEALCACLGLDAAAFPAVERRRDEHDALDARIAAQTETWDGPALMAALEARGVPAMFVYRDSEILAEPELTGGGFLQIANHPETGTRLYPGPLWRSRENPPRLRTPHYGLGEHNREVLCGRLGISEEAYAELERRQTIGTRFTFWPPWPRD